MNTHSDEAATTSHGGLRWWWSAFPRVQTPRDERPEDDTSVFGAPLHQALKHSSVAISLVTDDGEPYVWGYIPAVVAKIGYFLKQHATETEGIFRVNGSEKRVRDLCTLFDTPPTYGRTLDWSPYTCLLYTSPSPRDRG